MTYKTRGIVIRRQNIGEADKIITFYTANLGKIRAKANGVRKIDAKLAGHLELFMLSDLIFARGRNLETITSAQVIKSHPAIRQNLQKTSFAYFVIELIEKLVPMELKDTRIFNLLADFFQALDDQRTGEKNLSILLLAFEMKLLDLLGFAPSISRCLHCAKGVMPEKETAAKYFFSNVLGGILCEKCRPFDCLAPLISGREIKLAIFARSYKMPQVVNMENPTGFRIDEDLILSLSKKIDCFIKFIFEKNIRSGEFINKVKILENRINF